MHCKPCTRLEWHFKAERFCNRHRSSTKFPSGNLSLQLSILHLAKEASADLKGCTKRCVLKKVLKSKLLVRHRSPLLDVAVLLLNCYARRSHANMLSRYGPVKATNGACAQELGDRWKEAHMQRAQKTALLIETMSV